MDSAFIMAGKEQRKRGVGNAGRCSKPSSKKSYTLKRKYWGKKKKANDVPVVMDEDVVDIQVPEPTSELLEIDFQVPEPIPEPLETASTSKNS